MNEEQVAYAVRRALSVFDQWNDVADLVNPGESFYGDLVHVIEDAVHIGIQMASMKDVAIDEHGNVMRSSPESIPVMYESHENMLQKAFDHVHGAAERLMKDLNAYHARPAYETAGNVTSLGQTLNFELTQWEHLRTGATDGARVQREPWVQRKEDCHDRT